MKRNSSMRFKSKIEVPFSDVPSSEIQLPSSECLKGGSTERNKTRKIMGVILNKWYFLIFVC